MGRLHKGWLTAAPGNWFSEFTPTPNPSPQGGGGRFDWQVARRRPWRNAEANAAGSPSALWGGARGGGAYPWNLVCTALIVLALSALPAQTASLSVKRGVNLDIWTTWPQEASWGEPGVLSPYPEWRKFLKASDLEALKADGFDFLRMPVDPAPWLVDSAAGQADDLYAAVRDSARMVNAAGLKVIVDLHSIPAGPGRSIGTRELMDDTGAFDRYVDVLRGLARALSQEDPSKVALEVMNEPTMGCEGADANIWSGRLKQLFAAARASATRLTLVLSGSCWSSAEGLSAIDPADFPDDNLIWTFHSYDPFLLTHQGATWAGDFIQYVTGIPYPPYAVPRAELDAAIDRIKAVIDENAPWTRRSGMKAYLDELLAGIDTKEKLDAAMEKPFATVDAWARRHGISPNDILLGEFGMIRQEYQNPHVVPAAQRAAYFGDMIGHAERHGYAWSAWGFGGAFGVVQEFEGRPAEPDVLDIVRGLTK
ncbi:MAG: cellulase family glycosylhydrolase [Rhizobiaceae bacterium]|nr:cellulase family glycosylhydrolase [Rhizobiaceae bacterium]